MEELFRNLLSADGASDVCIEFFIGQYRRLAGGERGFIPEKAIVPAADIPDYRNLPAAGARAGRWMDQAVVVKLNGGLGTSMGLDAAKSLVEVRPGLRFIDLIVRQILHFRRAFNAGLPLVFLNSFRTEADTETVLAGYPELKDGQKGMPFGVRQNRVPKIRQDNLEPAEWPAEPDLAWCPPGHGDLYPILFGTGLLDRLIDAGIRYAFVSNSDNLAAVPNPTILAWFAESGAPFLMEVAARTESDRKGGHLARTGGGRWLLRERAQCETADLSAFEDVLRHGYFNTNNIWLHLPSLQARLRASGGFLPLPLIANPRPLDPRNRESPPVWQLETAMGSAIELFEGARVLQTGRQRFLPVKTTNDLLVVASDACRVDDGGLVSPDWPECDSSPRIDLDPAFYSLLNDFRLRFPRGIPSLRHCRELKVRGDVRFGADVAIRGRVEMTARPDSPLFVPDGSRLEG